MYFFIILFNFLDANAQLPKLEFAKSFGGKFQDVGSAIAVDLNGNVYTTGYYTDIADFDPDTSSYKLQCYGTNDLYVSKMDAFGNFLWAINIKVSIDASGYSIETDSQNNVYVTGRFFGKADFDPGIGQSYLTSNFQHDVFILKLTEDGTYIWAKSIGGDLQESGNALEIDSKGSIYITGYFQSTVDFDPNIGIHNITAQGESDLFVLKLDANGNLIWVKTIGGFTYILGLSVKVDADGNVVMAGAFDSTIDFDPDSGMQIVNSIGGEDVFVLKLDSMGEFVWVKRIGGKYDDRSNSIALDTSGNILLTGYFEGKVDFDPGSGLTNLISLSGEDVFLLKLDRNGNFMFAKNYGNSNPNSNLVDAGTSIAVDKNNTTYLSGFFSGKVSFKTSLDSFVLQSTGPSTNIFFLKLDEYGNFIWVYKASGLISKTVNQIKLDDRGNLYAVGYFGDTLGLDSRLGGVRLSSNGNSDVFIYKINHAAFSSLKDLRTFETLTYPNPTSGKINYFVSNSDRSMRIEIYDMSGNLVFNVKDVGTNNLIDLTNQANGIYIIKLFQNDLLLQYQKILKQ